MQKLDKLFAILTDPQWLDSYAVVKATDCLTFMVISAMCLAACIAIFEHVCKHKSNGAETETESALFVLSSIGAFISFVALCLFGSGFIQWLLLPEGMITQRIETLLRLLLQ